MTGLDLESFLHLLRADLGAWTSLGVIVLVLALMSWTSWGSRRALRKCLVLSLIGHFGLVLYGSTVPVVLLALQPNAKHDEENRDRIRNIRVSPQSEGPGGEGRGVGAGEGRMRGLAASFDRPGEALALADTAVEAPRPDTPETDLLRTQPEIPASPAAAPEVHPPAPPPAEARAVVAEAKDLAPPPTQVSPVESSEVAAPEVARRDEPESTPDPLAATETRLRPKRTPKPLTARDRPGLAALPRVSAPELEGGPETRPDDGSASGETTPVGPAEPENREVPPAEIMKEGRVPPALTAADPNLRGAERRPTSGAGRAGAFPARAPLPASSSPIAPLPGLGETAAASGDRRDAETGASGGGEGPPALTVPSAPGETAEVVKQEASPLPPPNLPDPGVRRPVRPNRPAPNNPRVPDRRTTDADADNTLALSRVLPGGVNGPPGVLAPGGRPLTDVPEVYRPRLDPNRSLIAQRAGASPASEQAVERALDWLARHQDADGRWDGATAKLDDGTVKKGDDDFTTHCPPGETCFGECLYWEADTALTGLALLGYLGAGYTHADGKYAEVVGKGLDFLISQQKPDGDLRGQSRAVGMYCHAMATIALCEAYALTGDPRLRPRVERAISFIIRSRAHDRLAWRYSPGAPDGDTSILGWVVMALKSAKVVGIPIPEDVQRGALGWLDKVADGKNRGLARYRPEKAVSPTMTAEAWVCRQFLGAGRPGPASAEAADFLLANAPDRGKFNLYYWYYGTLAMYQHGGDAWYRWNSLVRDQIVARQRVKGHQAGSWDPDESEWGTYGGRIYCTALATLSLEVYYRFLRLYDDPNLPANLAPATARPIDPTLRRMGNPPRRPNTR